MEKNQILAEVQEIFREVLDNEEIVLANETNADDIEEWDSLTHIQLIVAIEKHFKIKFTSLEILSWKNVGEMIDCIKSKI
ncbi:MAG: acyl carrier protein [Paludibacteraceae bacterium]|nr:acyl carrier protein [Paludibacteraceae bacterium]MBQ6724019.1 acyl carrier protein [Paludibacteraceae bacterium]